MCQKKNSNQKLLQESSETYSELQLKLKAALDDKIKATEENVRLAKICHESESNYIKLLFKMEDLHTNLMERSLKLKEYMEENQNLKEEIVLLKHLIEK